MAVGDHQPDFSSTPRPALGFPVGNVACVGRVGGKPAARSVVQVSKDLLVRSD